MKHSRPHGAAVLRSLASLRVMAAMCAQVLPAAIAAQNVITLRSDSTRRIVAPSGRLAVPVILDMSAAGGTNLASLTTGVSFSTSRLTFDSVRTAGFGSLTPNTTSAASGTLTLGVMDATGTTTTQTLATMYFTASATTGGTTIAFSPTVAGSDLGVDILSLIRTRSLDVCVAAGGKWGDVNGDSVATPLGDGNVNIIDAQQIARFSVGLAVANRPGIVARGDVTNDGNVNIIDGQQIVRYSVGLSAPARVNTAVATAPAVNTVTLQPSTPTVVIGQTVQLTGTALDAANAPLVGCAVVTYVSSDTTKATVGGSGLVSGISAGTAIITASSGGKSAQVTVTVSAPPSNVTRISIFPISFGIMLGDTVTVAATAYDASNNIVTGLPTTWVQPSNAGIAANGLLTGTAAGYSALYATVGGFTNSASGGVTVYSTVDSIRFSGWTETALAVGVSRCIRLGVWGPGGMTSPLRWTTAISNQTALQETQVTGLAETHCFKALTNSPVTVTASFGGKSVSKTLNPAASIAVVPASFGIMVGDTVTVRATAYDAANTVLTGVSPEWVQPGPAASISSTGLLTGLAAGYRPFQLTMGGLSVSLAGFSVYSTVDSARFTYVNGGTTYGWTDATLAVGATQCVALFVRGSGVGFTVALRWTSSVSDATVLQETQVTGLPERHCFKALTGAPVTVTASFGGKSATKTLNALPP